jgi:hypothetical protein
MTIMATAIMTLAMTDNDDDNRDSYKNEANTLKLGFKAKPGKLANFQPKYQLNCTTSLSWSCKYYSLLLSPPMTFKEIHTMYCLNLKI